MIANGWSIIDAPELREYFKNVQKKSMSTKLPQVKIQVRIETTHIYNDPNWPVFTFTLEDIPQNQSPLVQQILEDINSKVKGHIIDENGEVLDKYKGSTETFEILVESPEYLRLKEIFQ